MVSLFKSVFPKAFNYEVTNLTSAYTRAKAISVMGFDWWILIRQLCNLQVYKL